MAGIFVDANVNPYSKTENPAPIQRLARLLMPSSSYQSSILSPLGSQFGFPGRIRRAYWSLLEFESDRGDWNTVADRWNALQNKSDFSDWLSKQAGEVGASDGDVQAVATAISDELVPSLLLRCVLRRLQKDILPDINHRKRLDAWNPKTAHSAHLFCIWLETRVWAQKKTGWTYNVSRMLTVSTEHAVQSCNGDNVLQERLLRAYDQNLIHFLENLDSKTIASSKMEALTLELRRLISTSPPAAVPWSLFSSASLLHMITGAAYKPDLDTFSSNAYHFSLSLFYNPFNFQARELLEQLCTLPESARKILQEMGHSELTDRYASQATAEINSGFKKANEEKAGDMGQKIEKIRQSSIRNELLLRLNLDTKDKSNLDMVEDLINVISATDIEPEETYASRVRDTAKDNSRLPWTQIEEALSSLPASEPELLLHALPIKPLDPPQLSDVKAWSVEERRSGILTTFFEWLVFSRAPLLKLAITCGVLLLFHGGISLAYLYWHQRQCDLAYNDVIEGIRQSSDDMVVERGCDFIELAELDDPRVAQVAQWLPDATVREAVLLASSGESSAARRLLERFELVRSTKSSIFSKETQQ